jgi:GT2 family glycosyltransferase
MGKLAGKRIGMLIDLVTVDCGGPGLVIPEIDSDSVKRTRYTNDGNKHSPCRLYQHALEHTESDVIIYAHDDLTVHDSKWLDKIIYCMPSGNETVAVGLGGALGLGNSNLYRKPYNIANMARRHYMSNQTDAEVHGERYLGRRRVAVIEQFFMAIRTEWLRSIGGWPELLTHHCLDMWLACMAARNKKDIWMTGISCTHHGGGTSTSQKYADARWLIGGSRELDHQLPHKYIYNEFRDVLPIEIT